MSPALTRILITVPEAAALLGVSRTHFYEIANTDPTFPPLIKLGNATRIELAALLEWVKLKAVQSAQSRRRAAGLRMA